MSNRTAHRSTRTTTGPRVGAGARLRIIVTALGRRGWGPLAGRQWSAARTVLYGLMFVLPDDGVGKSTGPQLADAAGVHPATIYRGLRVLVDRGLVEYWPGGVDRETGRPTASLYRVDKLALVGLLNTAAALLAGVRAARKRTTDARIAGLKLIRPSQSIHARSATPAPTGARIAEAPLPIDPDPPPPGDLSGWLARCRAEIRPTKRPA